ncbi:hypothetical protein, partial [Streptomyces showdoensis]
AGEVAAASPVVRAGVRAVPVAGAAGVVVGVVCAVARWTAGAAGALLAAARRTGTAPASAPVARAGVRAVPVAGAALVLPAAVAARRTGGVAGTAVA